MIYLILISGLSNTRLLLFLNHFRDSSTIPYFKGEFIWIGKEREFHQCIKEKAILILRVIIDQFLLDLLNPWCAIKLFTTWEVMISYPMTNLRISNDTLLKRGSTQTRLHRVIDDWLEKINEGELTGACLLDISKCFDSINHEILLKKLAMYGFQDVELTWFKTLKL